MLRVLCMLHVLCIGFKVHADHEAHGNLVAMGSVSGVSTGWCFKKKPPLLIRVSARNKMDVAVGVGLFCEYADVQTNPCLAHTHCTRHAIRHMPHATNRARITHPTQSTTNSAVALKSADLVGDGDCNNVYCLTTHPGHHAGAESYGGYCFVNMCAVVVRRLQTKTQLSKIAVIDVDYHAGNGTASIFYTDPTVLVCSLHLDPDLEYPYNSGFEHQRGAGKGEGTTLHVPFPAATGWRDYSVGLAKVVEKVKAFGADAVVVSLGLDTLKGDPECVR